MPRKQETTLQPVIAEHNITFSLPIKKKTYWTWRGTSSSDNGYEIPSIAVLPGTVRLGKSLSHSCATIGSITMAAKSGYRAKQLNKCAA